MNSSSRLTKRGAPHLLNDRSYTFDSSPVEVQDYVDDQGRTYQVDTKRKYYRITELQGNAFGDWQRVGSPTIEGLQDKKVDVIRADGTISSGTLSSHDANSISLDMEPLPGKEHGETLIVPLVHILTVLPVPVRKA